ncbi:MAG TPA: 3'-5' exonuclease [Gammaproteobacteria bacterium]|nr:3'-5' exonuclease [Gammaproteobacteria bacterium]
MNVLVFDIETIPDVEAGRRLYELEGLSDEDVVRVLSHKRREETGDSDFLRLHMHRIVAISAVLRSAETLKVWSLGGPEAGERELIRRFFDGIERYTPVLVSWNGSGFDLPVLHYRSLHHGVACPRYWETGDDDTSFRWNNYLSRFHSRHTDLMDVLAAYQPRASVPLNELATLLGLPGKMGMDGGKVWEAYQNGEIEHIRNYCETDVLNTYLIYLRYELIRGRLREEAHQQECQRIRETLISEDKPHLTAFLQAWDAAAAAVASSA